jgi:ParB-like chromosome segregation protein Spo0J
MFNKRNKMENNNCIKLDVHQEDIFFVPSFNDEIKSMADILVNRIERLSIEDKIEAINLVRSIIHEISPFKTEPVDFVKWVQCEKVGANDYNPNSVAPPEMKLLAHSISEDGYTQPIVAWDKSGVFEVVDGFHRNRVGRENPEIKSRVHGYLPLAVINSDRTDINDRMASTIRHNRARGKHQVNAMSDIILELKNRNWKNERIARELGMDEEEILRLCQITGLQNIFSDNDFSKSWISSDSDEDAFEELTDIIPEDEKNDYRTINTDDPNRIFHTYDKWECAKAGLYASNFDGMKKEDCEKSYCEFLSDDERFSDALGKLIVEWKNSCEHYLTNTSMNRIAWLGQAAMCYATRIPSKYCAGFNLLSDENQNKANLVALKYLNIWLTQNNMQEVDLDDALSIGRQINIY